VTTGPPQCSTIAVTVAVCTRNRAESLDGCLASVATQSIDPGTVDLVVVDNGSTDRTAAVVRDWQTRVPTLRAVHERSIGLSIARNAALTTALAPVVAFLDDDARATPQWLGRLVDAHRDESVVVAGGRVELVWQSPPPRWMSPALESWYSALDLGPEPRSLGTGEYLVGCNFSVRRDAVRAVGGFDPGLGRHGDRLRSGEDWQLLDALRAPGRTVRYVPDAVVHHVVPDERARVRWLVRRAYEQGRTNAVLDGCAGSQWGVAVRSAARTTRGVLGDAVRWRRGVSMQAALPVIVLRAMGYGYARESASPASRRFDAG
jgi:glycosyltransferase involved in cell wall biosynthesis